jgi:hypothetical protein
MAVLSLVFSVRDGDILNLHKATYDSQRATEYVFNSLDAHKSHWFRLLEFPTIREYSVGETVKVVLDYDWKTTHIDMMEVCGVNDMLSVEARDDTLWADEIVVS